MPETISFTLPLSAAMRMASTIPAVPITGHTQARFPAGIRSGPHLPVMVLEYYNVSKFEDLPLLFTHSMAHDFQVYRRTGAAGFVYMHVPLVNWGMRALTQVLFAELAWDPDADIAKIKADFIFAPGTVHTRDGSGLYTVRSTASQQITSWRAWKDRAC